MTKVEETLLVAVAAEMTVADVALRLRSCSALEYADWRERAERRKEFVPAAAPIISQGTN